MRKTQEEKRTDYAELSSVTPSDIVQESHCDQGTYAIDSAMNDPGKGKTVERSALLSGITWSAPSVFHCAVLRL